MMTLEEQNQQRLDALKRANELRTERARLRRAVKAGEVSIEEVILDLPECVRKMPMEELMQWAPAVGQVKARRLVKEVSIATRLPLTGLSDERRQKLADVMTRYGSRRVAA